MEKPIIRLLTCGSVDDGKSTLIGRLLVETNSVPEDTVASAKSVRRSGSTIKAGEIDFSLLTDGLEAEREQGITIDVAYRSMNLLNGRRLIIADAPGHEQYTRNMAVAASRADIALVLVDATRGIRTQTLRHLTICSLMGVTKIAVVVNKLDGAGYSKQVFEDIEKVKYKEALIVPDCKLNDDVKDDNYKLGYLKGGIAVCNNYRTKHDFLVVEHLAVHHEGAEAYKSFIFDVFDCEIDQPLVKNDKYKKSIYIRSKGYYKTTIEDPNIIEKLLSPLTPEEYSGFLASCYDIIGASNGSEIKFTFKDKTLIDRIFEMLTHFGFSSKVRFLNKFKAYGDKFIIYDVVIQGGINEIVKFLRLCPIYNTKKRTKVLKVKRLDPPSKIIKIEEIKHDSPIMYPQIKTKYGFFNACGIIFKD
jgi:signal recognition particle receptor subunit beta